MVYLFKTTRDVIKAEKQMLENGVACKIVPVPRSLSSGCGMAIECEPLSLEETIIETLLNKENIGYKKHYNYKR